MQDYHDNEWGVPVRDERHLFELLILEGAQAGLSWDTILNRRQGYRNAFCDFDMERVARMTPADAERLRHDTSIIRNRLKIKSAITNAQAAIELRRTDGGLVEFLWSFVDGTPVKNRFETPEQWPAQTDVSRRMSKELKKRGFSFVGPTICYALMQSAGLVDDHLVGCWRY